MSHDVFICHASEDRTIATAICSTLEQHRIRCWVAPRDVVPGSDYAQSIVEAISSTRLTVLVFSDSSNHSPHVKREIERSVSHGVPILPFRVEDVVPSPSLEYFISDAHWLDAMTPPLEQHLDHLAKTVQMLLDREAGTGAVEQPAADSGTPVTAARTPPPAAPTTPASTPPAGPGPGLPLWRQPRWIVGAAVLLVAAVVTGVLLWRGTTSDPGTPAAGTAPTTSAAPATQSGSETPSDAPDEDIFVDEFDVPLYSGWTWVNEDPARWSLTAEPGWLQITAQQSPPMRNVLLRDAAWAGDDYDVATVVRFTPTSNFQFAGLILTGPNPEGDWLQFGRSFCDDDGVCVGDGLYFDRVKDGSLVGDNYATKLPADTGEIMLSLSVRPNEVSAWYSLDDGVNWTDLGAHPRDPGYTRVGVLAHQAATPVTASFREFAIVLP